MDLDKAFKQLKLRLAVTVSNHYINSVPKHNLALKVNLNGSDADLTIEQFDRQCERMKTRLSEELKDEHIDIDTYRDVHNDMEDMQKGLQFVLEILHAPIEDT